MGVRRTCGEPTGIELTRIGVKPNTRMHDAYVLVEDLPHPLVRVDRL